MSTFKRTTLATMVSAVIMGQAFAADNDIEKQKKQEKNTIERIEVTGFAESLDRADRLKKNAASFLDAITAEDVGELPADNIGDALFGLPGVDMDFEDGEAANIIIGGLPSEFNQIQVNGANVPSLANGTGSEGNVSLSGFSTSLMAGVEVIKSAVASADEGALGGTVKLTNWKPTTFKDTRLQVSATGVYHENSEELDDQFNFLYGDRNDEGSIGWVFGAALENKTTANEKAQINGSWRSTSLDGDADNGNETLLPTNIGYQINKTEIERTNMLMGLQYTLDEVDINFNYNYTKFDRLIQQDSIRTSRSWGKYMREDQQAVEAYVDPTSDAITHIARAGIWLTNDNRNGGTFTNMDRNDLTRVEENHNAKLDLTWYLSDSLTLDASLGYALNTHDFDPTRTVKSGFRIRESILWNTQGELPTYQTINREAASLLYNGGNPGGTLEGSEFEGFDINDQSTWHIITGGVEQQALNPADVEVRRVNTTTMENESESVYGQLDFTYYADMEFGNFLVLDSLQFGVKYNESDIERRKGDPNTAVGHYKGHWNLSDLSTTDTIGEDFYGGGFVNPGTWFTVDASELRDATMGSGAGTFPGYGHGEFLNYFNADKSFFREFNTLAAYLQANFSGDNFDGNFGVRFVSDDTTVSGYSKYDVNGPDYPFLDENGNPIYTNKKGVPVYPNHTSMFINPVDNPGLDSYIDFGVVDDLTNLANYNKMESNNKADYALPSLNIRYSLTDEDDMFLRFAASRSMTRQPISFTSAQMTVRLPGEDDDGDILESGVVGITGQNPHMKPTMANSASLGFEWYYGKASSITLSYNHRHIMGMRSLFEQRFEPGTFPDVNGIVPSEYYDVSPVVLRLREANGDGDVNTAEVSWKHNFSNLDGWIGNTGFSANYTYAESDVSAPISQIQDDGTILNEGRAKLPSAAPHSLNTQFYYQGEKLTARIAYTFRDHRLAKRSTLTQKDSRSTQVDFRAGIWADYVRDLKLSLSYKFTDKLKVNFNVNNLLDNDQIKTLADGTLVSTTRYGRQYKLNAIYRF